MRTVDRGTSAFFGLGLGLDGLPMRRRPFGATLRFLLVPPLRVRLWLPTIKRTSRSRLLNNVSHDLDEARWYTELNGIGGRTGNTQGANDRWRWTNRWITNC